MQNLNPQQVDELLKQPTPTRPPLRDTVDGIKQNISSGEGILPKVLGGAMAIPIALTHLKAKDVPIKSVTI